MDLIIGIVLAAGAAIGFAFGTQWQHKSVNRLDDTQFSKPLKQLFYSLKQPRWIAGVALHLFSAIAHLAALAFASITVIQPIGVLALPMSVLLSSKENGRNTPKILWLTSLGTILSIAGLTFFNTKASPSTLPSETKIMVAISIIFVACAVLTVLAVRTHGLISSLLWTISGAVSYGAASSVIKTIFLLIEDKQDGHLPAIILNLVLGIVFYAYGFVAIQRAYREGSPDIVISTLTTADPLMAVAYGLTVLGEANGVSAFTFVGMAVFGVLTLTSVFILSKSHPDAKKLAPDNTNYN